MFVVVISKFVSLRGRSVVSLRLILLLCFALQMKEKEGLPLYPLSACCPLCLELFNPTQLSADVAITAI